MSRIMFRAVAAAGCAALAAGCGSATSGSATNGSATNGSATSGSASSRSTTGGGSAETVAAAATTTATNGVPIHADPTRIVSLSASATEDLFAAGAGKQVVAVDQYSTYPRSAPRTKLSGYQPNIEAIAAYRPDLVIDDQDVGHLGAHLKALGIPVLIDGPPANLSGAYAQLEQLGAVSGHRQQATRVVDRLRAQVKAIVATVPRPNRSLTIYHELDQTFYSASSDTFIGQLYAMLGLRNIADKAAKVSRYPQLSPEYVIAADPDLIVLADTTCCGQSARTVAARPGWSAIRAVKEHHVLAVDDSLASEWGPRIVGFLRLVAAEVRGLGSPT